MVLDHPVWSLCIGLEQHDVMCGRLADILRPVAGGLQAKHHDVAPCFELEGQARYDAVEHVVDNMMVNLVKSSSAVR